MAQKRYKVYYDIKGPLVSSLVYSQGDIESAVLEVKLLDDTSSIDITGETIFFRFLKPDNTVVEQDINSGVTILHADAGVVECVLNSQVLALKGKVLCEIHRSEGGQDLTTRCFTMYVEGTILGSTTISEIYISRVENAIINLSQYAELARVSEENAKDSEVASKGSEDAAKASEDASEYSAQMADLSQGDAGRSRDYAATSESNAYNSEINSKTSEDNALLSEQHALVSESNADISEAGALLSEQNALASENAAKISEDAAKVSELNSKTSENNSKTSENNSKTSETNSKNSETLSEADQLTVTQTMQDFLAMLGEDVATLDGNGKIPISQIPATSTQEIYQISLESELINLIAQKGYLAEVVQTVDSVQTIVKTYQLLGTGNPAVLANWIVWGTSYAVQAGNATNATYANDSTMINGKRFVAMTQAQYDAAVKDPDTYYVVTPI